MLKNHLKKTKMINPKTEKIAILDETKSQNVPNTSRVLYEPGTKNIILNHLLNLE